MAWFRFLRNFLFITLYLQLHRSSLIRGQLSLCQSSFSYVSFHRQWPYNHCPRTFSSYCFFILSSLLSSHEQIPFPNQNPDPKPRNYSSVQNEMTYPRLLSPNICSCCCFHISYVLTWANSFSQSKSWSQAQKLLFCSKWTYPRLLLLSSTEFDWPWWDNVGHRWDRWGCRRRRRATGRRRRPAGWPLGTRPHRCRRFAPSGASARAATAWWCSTPAWRRAALTNHKPFGQGGGQWAIFGKIGWWSVSKSKRTVHKI